MGLFGKIKDIFYDTEIVEVEDEPEKKVVKKEEIKPKIEEIEPPRRETIQVKENTIPVQKETKIQSEREMFRSEPTFKFPLLDDDEEEPKIKTRSSILDFDKFETRQPKREEKVIEKREEKPIEKTTVFKPSPVISPVYGILDKNYKKDEIVERKDSASNYRPTKNEMNYDYVRRKAYGTLEDELENTLSRINSEEVFTEKEKSIEDLLSEINENATITPSSNIEEEKISNIETDNDEDDKTITQEIYYKKETTYKEPAVDKITEPEIEEDEEETPKKRTIEDIGDKTLEHDLFNLIDSMYEDKEEE